MDKTEEGKFKLRLDLRTGDPDLDLYLYNLHSYLIAFETSSVKQLIISLDRLSQKLCDDVDMLTDGNIEGLTILSPDAQDKIFERVMKLIEKIDSFKKVSETAESLRPEIQERIDEVSKSKPKQIKIELGDNPFETLQGFKVKKQ